MEVFDGLNRIQSKARLVSIINDSLSLFMQGMNIAEEFIPNIVTNPEKNQLLVDQLEETLDEIYDNIKSEIESKGYVEVKEYTLVGGLLQETIVKKPIILDGDI